MTAVARARGARHEPALARRGGLRRRRRRRPGGGRVRRRPAPRLPQPGRRDVRHAARALRRSVRARSSSPPPTSTSTASPTCWPWPVGCRSCAARARSNFDPPRPWWPDGLPSAAVVADFNRDGRPDVGGGERGLGRRVAAARARRARRSRLECRVAAHRLRAGRSRPSSATSQVEGVRRRRQPRDLRDRHGHARRSYRARASPARCSAARPRAWRSLPTASPRSTGAELRSASTGRAGATGSSSQASRARRRRTAAASRSAPSDADRRALRRSARRAPASYGSRTARAATTPTPGRSTPRRPPPSRPLALLVELAEPAARRAAHTLGLTARVDGCVVTPPTRSIYFGDLVSRDARHSDGRELGVRRLHRRLGQGAGDRRAARPSSASGATGRSRASECHHADRRRDRRHLRAQGRELPGPGHVLRGRDHDARLRPSRSCRRTSGRSRSSPTCRPARSGTSRLRRAATRTNGQNRLLWVNTAAPRRDQDPLEPGARGHDRLPPARQPHCPSDRPPRPTRRRSLAPVPT